MWFSLILFIIILFLYIHLQHQYKRHSEIKIFEVEYLHKTQFLGACELRQPFISTVQDIIPLHANVLEKHNDITYEVKNTDDSITEETSIDTVSLPYSQTQILFETDKNAHFFTERNYSHPIIQEIASHWDAYLKPPYTVKTTYDVLFGSKNTCTPFTYHCSTSKYLFISEREVKVQMFPAHYATILNTHKDYEHFEFTAQLSSQKPPPVEFWMYPGQVLYIPPYVLYSIQFKTSRTIACTAEYSTVLNAMSNAKHWMLYIMQNQNINVQFLKPFHSIQPDWSLFSTTQPEVIPESNTPIDSNDNRSDSTDLDEEQHNTLDTTVQENISNEFVNSLKPLSSG